MTRGRRNATRSNSQTNPYQQVIDIVANGYDAAKISTALAKKYPQLFVELYHDTCTPPEKWMQELIAINYRGERDLAIELLCKKTGVTLKEANDVVDHLTDKMHKIGYMVSPSTITLPSLSPVLDRIVEDLANAAFRCK